MLAENQARIRLSPIFATPVLIYDWPACEELNRRLQDVILSREERSPGETRSNVGGWHSPPDLLSWDAAAILQFRDRLDGLLIDAVSVMLTSAGRQRRRDLTVSAWANVMRNGAYHAAHDHPGAHWSGVYYVSAGEPDRDVPLNGRLELLDPRSGIGMYPLPDSALTEPCVIDTVPGRLILFPSWLRHMVHPFRGQGARISIALNASIVTV